MARGAGTVISSRVVLSILAVRVEPRNRKSLLFAWCPFVMPALSSSTFKIPSGESSPLKSKPEKIVLKVAPTTSDYLRSELGEVECKDHRFCGGTSALVFEI